MEEINLTGKERRVAKLLLRYMKSHPEAKHTAEGIARWWILQQKMEEEVGKIENVIDYFINIGMLERVSVQQDQIYYKFNTKKVVQFIERLNNLQDQENKY